MNNVKRPFVWVRTIVALGCCLGLVALSGCKGLSSGVPWLKGEKSDWLSKEKEQQEHPKGEPSKLIVNWSDVIYTPAGGTPTRGFGGRVYFYNEHSQSLQVEGSLVVYTFDEAMASQGQSPERRYVIKPEQLAQHYSPSELGPSYSVWIPWDAVGGPEKTVSLLAKFTSASGRTIIGDQSKHVLPGPKAPASAPLAPAPRPLGALISQAGGSGVQQVSYSEPLEDAGQASGGVLTKWTSPGVQTTTINLPPGLQRSVAAAGPLSDIPANYPANGYVPAAAAANMIAPNGMPAYGMVAYGMPANMPVAVPATLPTAPATAAAPPAHSPLPTRRALGAPIERLTRDRGPWRPSPAGLQPGSPQLPLAAP